MTFQLLNEFSTVRWLFKNCHVEILSFEFAGTVILAFFLVSYLGALWFSISRLVHHLCCGPWTRESILPCILLRVWMSIVARFQWWKKIDFARPKSERRLQKSPFSPFLYSVLRIWIHFFCSSQLQKSVKVWASTFFRVRLVLNHPFFSGPVLRAKKCFCFLS